MSEIERQKILVERLIHSYRCSDGSILIFCVLLLRHRGLNCVLRVQTGLFTVQPHYYFFLNCLDLGSSKTCTVPVAYTILGLVMDG
jgi:hypothetical protein